MQEVDRGDALLMGFFIHENKAPIPKIAPPAVTIGSDNIYPLAVLMAFNFHVELQLQPNQITIDVHGKHEKNE